ncbi:MAG: hypothetical protein QXQ69_00385 [Candidatus Aenigmatarchaeota archaeon]
MLAIIVISALIEYYNVRYFFNFLASFAIIIISSIAAYFGKKFLENFEKNEQYVATLIFIHPKIRESFKIMFLATFVFGIMWSFLLLRFVFSLQNIFQHLIVILDIAHLFSTYFVPLSIAYFFKNLYEITKSD